MATLNCIRIFFFLVKASFFLNSIYFCLCLTGLLSFTLLDFNRLFKCPYLKAGTTPMGSEEQNLILTPIENLYHWIISQQTWNWKCTWKLFQPLTDLLCQIFCFLVSLYRGKIRPYNTLFKSFPSRWVRRLFSTTFQNSLCMYA